MTVDSLRALFVHELEGVYYAERELVNVLDEMAQRTETEDIATAFDEHREETESHVERLERVFEIVDVEATETECQGIDGLVAEHDAFVQMDPDQAILDAYNVTAVEKMEHYEVAAYGNLAFYADELGLDEAADLLGQTLEEEERALDTWKSLTEEYDYGQIEAAA